MKPPPIRTWTEPVDGAMVAGIAKCFVSRAGGVYGLAVFVLCDAIYDSEWANRRAARTVAEQKLVEAVHHEHGGRLPYVGRIRDVGGDGVDMTW